MGAGMMERAEVQVARDASALANLSAESVVAMSAAAIENHGSFYVALSGGTTPRALFTAMAGDEYRNRVDWANWEVFFSDERFVPPDSPDSNYNSAREALLSHVPVSAGRVHSVLTEDISPDDAAGQYEAVIRGIVPGDVEQDARFDLILLGLGPDGHTASLFPDTEALAVQDRLVTPNYVPSANMWRITFTYPLINRAHTVAFLAEGEAKAQRVWEVLHEVGNLPASGVQPTNGRLLWLLDREAAALLGSGHEAQSE
ncbi:MAG: 6-phosphogluconolactonase [Acidobacteriaceae bacterium]